MSKKFLPILFIATLLLVAVILALPKDVTASELLGITPTTPPPTSDTPTEPPSTKSPSKPKTTEVVLLPATGESPTNPSQGMQWFFALTIIFLIGFILIRELKSSKIKK